MHLQATRTPELLASEILDHHALRHWLARPAQEWTERRFDPLDWVYQSLAYDAHDVGKTFNTQEDTALALALANIQAKTLVLGARPDLYNPVDFAEWASKEISGCVYTAMNSDWGTLPSVRPIQETPRCCASTSRRSFGHPKVDPSHDPAFSPQRGHPARLPQQRSLRKA